VGWPLLLRGFAIVELGFRIPLEFGACMGPKLLMLAYDIAGRLIEQARVGMRWAGGIFSVWGLPGKLCPILVDDVAGATYRGGCG